MTLLSVLLGAGAIFWSTFCVTRPRRRLEGIVLGSAGLAAGSVAVLAYTLPLQLRGLDIDFIPNEPAAEWFVMAFGWAALLAKAVLLVRPLRPAPPMGPSAPGDEATPRPDDRLAPVVPMPPRGAADPPARRTTSSAPPAGSGLP